MSLAIIQHKLNELEPGGTLPLERGDYAPCVINKSVTLLCDDATFWTDGSVPSIAIRANNVVIKDVNLRGLATADHVVFSVEPDRHPLLQNIRIFGRSIGAETEPSEWILPPSINTGVIPPQHPGFYLDFGVPQRSQIVCRISGVSMDPAALSPGINTVKLQIRDAIPDSILIGEVDVIGSVLTRTIPFFSRISALASLPPDGIPALFEVSLAEKERFQRFLSGISKGTEAGADVSKPQADPKKKTPPKPEPLHPKPTSIQKASSVQTAAPPPSRLKADVSAFSGEPQKLGNAFSVSAVSQPASVSPVEPGSTDTVTHSPALGGLFQNLPTPPKPEALQPKPTPIQKASPVQTAAPPPSRRKADVSAFPGEPPKLGNAFSASAVSQTASVSPVEPGSTDTVTHSPVLGGLFQNLPTPPKPEALQPKPTPIQKASPVLTAAPPPSRRKADVSALPGEPPKLGNAFSASAVSQPAIVSPVELVSKDPVTHGPVLGGLFQNLPTPPKPEALQPKPTPIQKASPVQTAAPPPSRRKADVSAFPGEPPKLGNAFPASAVSQTASVSPVEPGSTDTVTHGPVLGGLFQNLPTPPKPEPLQPKPTSIKKASPVQKAAPPPSAPRRKADPENHSTLPPSPILGALFMGLPEEFTPPPTAVQPAEAFPVQSGISKPKTPERTPRSRRSSQTPKTRTNKRTR
jgi:hypothetical protein